MAENNIRRVSNGGWRLMSGVAAGSQAWQCEMIKLLLSLLAHDGSSASNNGGGDKQCGNRQIMKAANSILFAWQ